MFWPLFLAHLLADYPLQTDSMVRAKKALPGLTMHVTIHLLTLVVILNGFIRFEWSATLPAVLAVTVLHFGIDTWKNFFSSSFRW